MKHARQKIREKIATILVGVSGVSIYTSRVYPMVTLPVISVYALDELSDTENELIGAPLRYTRQLALNVDIAVSSVSGYDDLADDYAAQCEALLASDVTFGGTATDSKLVSTRMELDGSSENPIATTSLVYQVWYRTTGADAETPL